MLLSSIPPGYVSSDPAAFVDGRSHATKPFVLPLFSANLAPRGRCSRETARSATETCNSTPGHRERIGLDRRPTFWHTLPLLVSLAERLPTGCRALRLVDDNGPGGN